MGNCKAIYIPAITLMVILSTTACVYLPPIGQQFSKEKQFQIVIGKTTKDDVIKMLGKPDILEDDHFFIYDLPRDHGMILIFTPAGGGGFPINEQHFAILLQFDNRNVIERYEIESGQYVINRGVFPEAAAAPTNRRR